MHDEKRLIFQQKSGFYPTDFSSFLVAIVWISGINVKLTLGVGVGVGVGVGACEDPMTVTVHFRVFLPTLAVTMDVPAFIPDIVALLSEDL